MGMYADGPFMSILDTREAYQDLSRQKSHIFVLLVYLFTLGRGLLLHLNSGIAKVPSMMYINMENKAMGLLA